MELLAVISIAINHTLTYFEKGDDSSNVSCFSDNKLVTLTTDRHSTAALGVSVSVSSSNCSTFKSFSGRVEHLSMKIHLCQQY